MKSTKGLCYHRTICYSVSKLRWGGEGGGEGVRSCFGDLALEMKLSRPFLRFNSTYLRSHFRVN